VTFDDGPSNDTRKVLDLLARYDAKATFFVVGTQVGGFPETLAAVKAEGHAVGNHTWSHKDLARSDAGTITEQLQRTSSAAGTGPCMRPPYGSIDAQSGAISESLDLQPVLWTAQAYDWKTTATPEQIVSDIEAQTKPGAVVLLHDGGGDRSKTVQALQQLLPYWKSQGYRLEPVPACVGR
jgi:peptidoglycan/xylan/chitin deacetylase (PgdA/CDA1 family)